MAQIRSPAHAVVGAPQCPPTPLRSAVENSWTEETQFLQALSHSVPRLEVTLNELRRFFKTELPLGDVEDVVEERIVLGFQLCVVEG